MDGAVFGRCQAGTVALRLFHFAPHLYAGVPDEADIVEIGQQLRLHNFVFLCQFVKFHHRRQMLEGVGGVLGQQLLTPKPIGGKVGAVQVLRQLQVVLDYLMLQHIVRALVGHDLLNTFSRHLYYHIPEEIILAIGCVGVEVGLDGVQVLQRFSVDLL